jgi:hypothetical protein
MNLVPIDTGGTAPELLGGDASPGGDFAALITGLMSGDTQIVPLIDVPVGEQLPQGSETSDVDDGTDIGASILEFIGTPPSGLTISSPPAETPPTGLATKEPNVLIESDPESAPAPDDQIVSHSAAQAGIDSAVGTGLATVHPISTRAAHSTPAQSATSVAGIAFVDRAGREPEATSTIPVGTAPQTAGTPIETAPQSADTPTETAPRTAGSLAEARPTPTSPDGANPLGGTLATDGRALDTSTLPRHIDAIRPLESRTEPTSGEPPTLQPDVELDTGTATRPVETARPTAAISQPVMVGVARRVEEAIAALAAKPDPKIVTLQLDELDGLRLTVALRPDGLHLSSSGDAALTTEIERALASRGFDMASDRGRQGSEEPADDGWKPQPTDRRRPTNQPGIRL